MAGLDPLHMALALALTLVAGFVKGAVGFAGPMIMISGLGSFLPPDLALAALILPTLMTNLWQALRQGRAAALAAIRAFRFYMAIVLLFIAGAAQLVAVLPARALYLLLGLPITAFAAMQLAGIRPRIRPQHRRRAEILIGALAGFVGGMSGVWGPPTVAYLTALDTGKAEAMRVQGVVYGAAAVMLLVAHLRSGVLNAATAPLSALLMLPSALGMVLGLALHDRLDARRFRQATLAVLVVAGLNLLRRGLA
jgi:uncharacterized membrane protein YfcA